jgi:ankyrin repeat protein
MSAIGKWNVRIIDYLMERGVDPAIKDKYGFTARRKAELRQLRTIANMLTQYEEKYADRKKFTPLTAVTNEYWVRQLKLLNARLARESKGKQI